MNKENFPEYYEVGQIIVFTGGVYEDFGLTDVRVVKVRFNPRLEFISMIDEVHAGKPLDKVYLDDTDFIDYLDKKGLTTDPIADEFYVYPYDIKPLYEAFKDYLKEKEKLNVQ